MNSLRTTADIGSRIWKNLPPAAKKACRAIAMTMNASRKSERLNLVVWDFAVLNYHFLAVEKKLAEYSVPHLSLVYHPLLNRKCVSSTFRGTVVSFG